MAFVNWNKKSGIFVFICKLLVFGAQQQSVINFLERDALYEDITLEVDEDSRAYLKLRNSTLRFFIRY